jgi:hypothetical protein
MQGNIGNSTDPKMCDFGTRQGFDRASQELEEAGEECRADAGAGIGK